MTGALKQMAAREHALDLLCEAEEQRAAGDAKAERPSAGARSTDCSPGASGGVEARTGRKRRGWSLCRQIALDDRRSVRLRTCAKATARDERAVAGLSPRSAHMRFAAPIRVLSQSMLEQMMGFDGMRHVVDAALTPDESEIVGVARFVIAERRQSAEVAIAIADRWQGHRLGSELLWSLIARGPPAWTRSRR